MLGVSQPLPQRSRATANRTPGALVGALLVAGCLLAATSVAQPVAPVPPPLSAAAPGSPEVLSAGQLDQLTAPIALYPDPLLGQILAAATYPLEVVEAARWLSDPANAALRGNDLLAALDAEPWDPSVKALVAFPDVLRRMDSELEWTEAIGNAFLAQQADVMDSVQRLRARAAAAHALASTPQETIGSQGSDITIEPANPDVVYVPYYVPAIVFAPWPWPDYDPYFFSPPDEVVYGAALIGFGIGIPIVGPLWGAYGWNWPQHGLIVSPHHPPGGRPWRSGEPHGALSAGASVGRAQPWTHDPAHREGVPYRTAAVAARFGGAQSAARSAYRGFPARTLSPPAPAAAFPGGWTEPRRSAAPAFESFGRGAQVRSDAARGFSSRTAPPPRPAAAPARGPSGRGR